MERRRGRQKVEMVKMEKESNLQVTFSKRRSGLFKKASELCTLCGAEVGLIVFSPGNKVFSFGHPDLGIVVDRYLQRSPPETSSGTTQVIEAHRNAYVQDLNMQLTEVTNQLEIEKKRGEDLSKMRKENQSQNWWESPIEELNLQQLQQLKSSFEELKKNVAKQAENLVIHNTNSSQQFLVGGSSTGSREFPNNYEALRNNNNINIPFNSNMMPHQEYNNIVAPNIVPSGLAGYNPIDPQGYNMVLNPQPRGYNPTSNPKPQGYNPASNPPRFNPTSGHSDQFGHGIF